jgi:hypothetical protein
MRKMGMRLALLGGFAGAALLAGCNDNPYDFGRKWSLSAQEDYYSEQAQDAAAQAYSNVGTSATLFETDEQKRGTGGAGEAGANAGDNEVRSQGTRQAQPNLWLQQDLRVPYPPPRFDAQVAMELGTGKPLRAGPNGAWVQGTHGVELGSVGSGLTTAKGEQAPKGQRGQPPAPNNQ